MTWLFSLHIFTSVNNIGVAFLTAAGIAAAVVAARKSKFDFASFDKKYYLLLLPLALSWLLLPFPYNLGIILAFLGLAVIPLHTRWQWASALSVGLLFSGAILIVQSPISHMYAVFTSKSHEFSFLSPFIYGLLDFLNVPVSYGEGTVFVQMMRELHVFTTTWDKMALFPFLNLLVGGGILLWLFSKEETINRKAISLSLFIVIGAIYLVVRYILMILLFVYLMYFVGYYEDVNKVSIFWSAPITALSFVPFLLLLLKLFPLKDAFKTLENRWSAKQQSRRQRSRRQPSKHRLSRRHIVAGAFLCLSMFLVVSAIGFHDPGKDKPGRLLIDEKHSDWEVTTKKYDTEWYGQESGYNYYCIADYLNYYYRLDRNFDEITPQLLSDYDVLILKVPTEPFSKDEIKSVVEFVEDGGGLLLLGEHTNVFGSSAYLNPIAKQFGFFYRYDCIFDIENKFEQVYVPPKLLPHPTVQNMPPFFFAVSCSIEPRSYFADKAILASGLKSLDIDYHASNFYPQVEDAVNMDFGAFVQMIAVNRGKGRVIGFTDSTVFSNFSAFIPGKPELLLGSINWLNKKNSLGWLNFVLIFLAVGFFVSSFIVLKKLPKDLRFVSLVIVVAVCMIALAISLFTFINRVSYPLPKPHTAPTQICFEKEHSNYELPILEFTRDRDKSYAIFYQWVLRLGYFPGVGPGINDCVKQGDLVVIINPQRDFTSEEVVAVKNYISRGGKVLLMDDPANTDSSANSLLQAFGMKIDPSQQASYSSIHDETGTKSWPIAGNSLATISGGKGLLFVEGERAVLSVVEEGNGTLAVMSFGNSFVDSKMGNLERVTPDDTLLRKFRLEFAIIRGLVNDNLQRELSSEATR